MVSDFIEMFNNFWNFKAYNKYTFADKSKCMFMINRRCSIKFPLQAALLSKMGMSAAGVVDFWQDFLTTNYNSSPGWTFTKVNKSTKDKSKKLTDFDTTLLNSYCKINKCDMKTLQETFNLYPAELTKELKRLKDILDI